MPHTYLSYAPADLEFASTLAGALAESGFRTSEQPGPNASFDEVADDRDRLRRCDAVIAVLSPDAILSSTVNYEWAFALGSGIPLVPILRSLSEDDLHPRLRIIQYLDFTNESPQNWDALIQALRKVRSAGPSATINLPRNAPPILQHAARALDSMKDKDRAKALATLGEMNHPAVVDVLAQAVTHPVQQVRFGAAIHLAAHQDARAIPALLDAMRAGYKPVEPWMLGNIGHAAIPGLIAALEDSNESVQGDAAIQLGRIGGPVALAALLERLDSTDSFRRRSAAWGLERAADRSAIPGLLAAAGDPDRDTRNSVLGALVKCSAETPDDADVIAALIRALDDEYGQVGIKATEGLARSRDPQVVAALVQAALTNPLEQVRTFSRMALEPLGDAAAPYLREAAATGDPVLLYRAISLLRRTGDERDIPLFLEAIRHPDRDIRHIAVCALWDNRARQGVPALVERLNDDDDDVCVVAARALGQIRDPRAVPALVECLDNREGEFASECESALRQIGTREAWSALKAWKLRTKK